MIWWYNQIMKYLKRLVYRSEGQLFNPLMHIFLFITLVFGVAFGIAPHVFGADQTVLYAQTLINIGHNASSAWGWGLILVTIGNTVLLATRIRWLGGIVSCCGFMLWLYALITYMATGYWLGSFAAALPNLLFWAWYYFRVKSYHRNPPFHVDGETRL